LLRNISRDKKELKRKDPRSPLKISRPNVKGFSRKETITMLLTKSIETWTRTFLTSKLEANTLTNRRTGA